MELDLWGVPANSNDSALDLNDLLIQYNGGDLASGTEGGALISCNTGLIQMELIHVIGNQNDSSGGGMKIISWQKLSLHGCNFDENDAQGTSSSGGGLMITGGQAGGTIGMLEVGCAGNVAGSSGGGMYIEIPDEATISLDGLTIESNVSSKKWTSGYPRYGGAGLYAVYGGSNPAPLAIANSFFTENEGYHGSAVFIDSPCRVPFNGSATSPLIPELFVLSDIFGFI